MNENERQAVATELSASRERLLGVGEGLTPEQSILQAARQRFRPITMTTLAAVFGAIPIALGHGAGSEIRQPLGITIIGGLVLSQILTLYTTPVVYLYLDRLRHWTMRKRKRVAA